MTYIIGHPTDQLTILMPQNPSNDVSELHKVRLSPDLKAQTWWNVWSSNISVSRHFRGSLLLSWHHLKKKIGIAWPTESSTFLLPDNQSTNAYELHSTERFQNLKMAKCSVRITTSVSGWCLVNKRNCRFNRTAFLSVLFSRSIL